jgi:hypothetical protein
MTLTIDCRGFRRSHGSSTLILEQKSWIFNFNSGKKSEFFVSSSFLNALVGLGVHSMLEPKLRLLHPKPEF